MSRSVPRDRASSTDASEEGVDGGADDRVESVVEKCIHPVETVELLATDGMTSYVQCGLCDAVFVLWRA